MSEHPSSPASVPRDDGTETLTTSPIRAGKKSRRMSRDARAYKRKAQTGNLSRSGESFTFITNLIHLLPLGELKCSSICQKI